MIQVAFIQENGEISHIISPGTDSMYEDSAVYDGLLAKHISANENPTILVENYYWSFNQSDFVRRPLKPSFAHIWENESWKFNSAIFWAKIRRDRDLKLTMSDWSQMPDSPLSSESKEAWRVYRQALRDLPAANAGVTVRDLIIWPEEP